MPTPQRPKLLVVTPDNQRREQSLRRRLPKPAISVHKRSKARLRELLEECFAASDDHFFDLAKSAQLQADQDSFFCAMRELRCKKSKILETFFDGFETAFLALAEVNREDRARDDFAAMNIDKLAIVGHDDLDRLVAKEAMISRAHTRCKHSLEQLTRRFDAVVPGDVLAEHLPVSPAQLCELFIQACKTLDIDSRAFLVLFKLFERTLLNPIDALYGMMNAHLEERGILPSSSPIKTPRSNSPAYSSGGLEQAVDPEFLHLDANHLLTSLPRPQESAPHTAAGATGNTAIPVAATSTTGIGSASAGAGFNTGSDNGRPAQRLPANFAAHIVAQLTGGAAIAAPLLPLIAQLETPIAGVAAQDESFFSNHNHATRRLLNTLVKCALGFDKSSDEAIEVDPLFAKLASVIAKLQHGYGNDAQLHQNLLKELEQFLRQEQRRADLYERRMVDAENGKHKAEKARQKVLETIADCTRNALLAPTVQELINKPWYQVMFVSALKHGTQSDHWQEVCATLEELVRAVQPPANEAQYVARIANLPALCARVSGELEALYFDAFDVQNVIQQLSLAVTAGKYDNARPAVKTQQVAAQEVGAAEATATVEIQPVFLAQAKNIGRGTWCDFKVSGEEQTRCRLAAIIGDFEKYIFVRRDGTKFAEKTFTEVAAALAAQSLVVLDSNKLFDQALEQVIGGRKKR